MLAPVAAAKRQELREQAMQRRAACVEAAAKAQQLTDEMEAKIKEMQRALDAARVHCEQCQTSAAAAQEQLERAERSSDEDLLQLAMPQSAASSHVHAAAPFAKHAQAAASEDAILPLLPAGVLRSLTDEQERHLQRLLPLGVSSVSSLQHMRHDYPSHAVQVHDCALRLSVCALMQAKLRLLYRGSEHGLTAKALWERCDGKANTLTVVMVSRCSLCMLSAVLSLLAR
jgi:hypothetical protein